MQTKIGIIDEVYAIAKQVIEENRERLSNMARALLKYETQDADEVALILEGDVLDKPTVTDLLAAEQARSEQQNPSPKILRLNIFTKASAVSVV